MKNLPFYLLACLLIISTNSCHKNDHDNYNSYSINLEEEVIQDQPTPEERMAGFHQQSIESLSLMFQLFHPLVKGMIENPELFLFTNNAAVVRSGCPCSSLSQPAGTFPNTLTLTFDDGSGSCTITQANTTKVYSGTLEFVFDDTNGSGTVNSGDDLIINQVTNFTVDNYSFVTSKDWRWDIESGGIDNNTTAAEQADVTVTNTATNATTFWEFSRVGLGEIDIDWGSPTIFSDPTALLNLEYTIDKSLGASEGVPVTCTSAGGDSQDLCVGFTDLIIKPDECGCFQNGDMFVAGTQDLDGDHCNLTSSTRTKYEFEYLEDGGIDASVCDAYYRKDLPGFGGLSIEEGLACQ